MSDPVFVKNPGAGSPWLSGHITQVHGPVSYTVTLSDGRQMRKHVDQIRARTVTINDSSEDRFDDFLPTPSSSLNNDTTQNTPTAMALPPRHSTRIRCPPSRYAAEQYC